MIEEFSYKNIWKISYPLILGGIGQTIINISDTIFLGRVSELALGVSAIAGLYYITFFMLGVGFSVGSQIMIARFDGEKKYHKIGEVFSHSFIFMMGLATILFTIMFYGSAFFLTSLVKSKPLVQSCVEFLKYRSVGIFAGFFVLQMRSFFSGISFTKMIGYTTLVSALFNIVFNYLFVFGHYGFPCMGIAGSGFASSLAECCAALFSITYFYYYADIKKYRLVQKFNYNKELFIQLLKTAFPLMIQVFIALWSWFLFFLIVEKMGERELAISNLTRNVYMILMLCLMGFSNATNTIISNLIGQNRKLELFKVLKKIIILSLSSTLLVAIINLLFAKSTLAIFTNNESLINESLGCIYVISGSSLFFSVSYILLSAVSGSGNTYFTLFIEVATLFFYLVATYLLAVKFKTSIELVWCTEFVYFVAMGILSYYYLKIKVIVKN